MPPSRRLTALLAGGLLAAGVSGGAAVPAFADGSGYGGDNLGNLHVTWVDSGPAVYAAAAPVVPGDRGDAADPNAPTVSVDGADLHIVGYGFRRTTAVAVQVGEQPTVERTTDATGTLTMRVPAADAAAPGASVLATGLSASGTTRTLIGSVPPAPSGFSPSGAVPWLAAAAAVAAAAVAGRRWRAQAGSVRDVCAEKSGEVPVYPAVNSGEDTR